MHNLIHPIASSSQVAVIAGTSDDGIQAIRSGLEELKKCIGDVFLPLGEALRSIAEKSRTVAEFSRSSTDLADTSRLAQGLEALRIIVADAERLHTIGTASQTKLQNIVTEIRLSRTSLARLAQVPLTLRAVSLLSQIENKRLEKGGGMMSNLHSEIRALADTMERTLNKVQDDASHVARMLEEGMRALGHLDHEEQQETANLLSKNQQLLQGMNLRAKAAETASRKIEEEYADIRKAIHKIIISLQSEDILRQRIEHIEQVLQDVVPAADAEHISTAMHLQREQLCSARDLAEDSMSGIRESIVAVQRQVANLKEDTQQLANQTDEEGSSLNGVIQEGLRAVTFIVDRYSGSAAISTSKLHVLVDAISELSHSMKEVNQLQTAIHFISLNAIAETTQLHGDGAAMSALASELDRMNEESRGDTTLILNGLLVIDKELKSISEKDTESTGPSRESSHHYIKEEFGRLERDLMSSAEQMQVNLRSLLTSTAALHSDLAFALDLIGGGGKVAECFQDLDTQIEKRLSTVHVSYAANLEPPRLHHLRSLYSMEAERQVHRKAISNGASEPDEVLTPVGSDIELF